MDGQALLPRPQLDELRAGRHLDGLPGPVPGHAVEAPFPLHEAVAADLALLTQKGCQPLSRRQRVQEGSLLRQAIGRPLTRRTVQSLVGDPVAPAPRLAIEVVVLGEAGRRPEIAAQILDAALDSAFGLGTI